MIIGYARVSTQDQNTQLQRGALEEAGCEQIFEERVTGTKRERPELQDCLRTLRDGDTLVVWKLDRLARSLKDLVELIHDLDDTRCGLPVAHRGDRYYHCRWQAGVPHLRRSGQVRTQPDSRAHPGRPSGAACPWSQGWASPCPIGRRRAQGGRNAGGSRDNQDQVAKHFGVSRVTPSLQGSS